MKSPLVRVGCTRTLAVLAVLVVLSVTWSCSSSDDSSSSSSSSGVFGGTSDSGSTAGVECTHPGAGSSLGGGRCDCPAPRQVSGDWSAKKTCRDNGNAACVKDQDETIKVNVGGTNATLVIGGASFSGTACGDFIIFSGPRAGGTECGQVRLTDDTHWFYDTCFVASGDCSRTFGQGCPSQKGQCTGTGTKGGAATAIAKDICK